MAFLMRKISVTFTLYVMSCLVNDCAAEENKTTKQPSSITQPPLLCYGGVPGLPGKPGMPGKPGTDGRAGFSGVSGRDGRDGREGAKGDQGSPGKTGPQGPQGSQGTPGINGKDGAKGQTGAQGPSGQKGERGETGTSGTPGNPGVMPFKNWKECAWKDLNDGRDTGLIKDCVFTKNFSDTSLVVKWTGALRIYRCTDCCRRWYFTFNGAECSSPLPIDGIVYMWQGNTQDLHRVRHIEGHCNNIHKGVVRVGFRVGDCAHRSKADAYTGWQSVSRIFVEEVPRPQA